jgi:anti-sigma regulatory factor (Ser/Thr protein kinase)
MLGRSPPLEAGTTRFAARRDGHGAVNGSSTVSNEAMPEYHVPAVPESVPQLRAAVSELARELGVDDETLANVRLALTEALANALSHGYHGADGTIEVDAHAAPPVLVVSVRDRGVGVANALPSSGLGMGLKLIAACTEDLRIWEPLDGGTEVRMAFRLQGAPALSHSA